MATQTPHITAAILFSRHVPDLSKQGRTIIVSMTNNPHFSSPNPTLVTLSGALDNLDAAETATRQRTAGAAQARNLKLTLVKNLLLQLKAYVQQIADATPDQAEAIITSAGMSVRKSKPRQKQANDAKQDVSGTVFLTAIVAALASSYEWQMSVDAKNWTNLPTTSKSKTGVTGLTAGQVYFFRNRPVLRKGNADWSQPYSLLVK
jgi:hypothetical protein